MPSQTAGEIGRRKEQHIELALDDEVQFQRLTGLERFEFVHQALPELSLSELETATSFLGRSLVAPILVSGMTGGTERAAEINRRVAEAVRTLGLGMGVGSQRIAVERPELTDTFQVRSVAPDILLIANLGAVQLNYGFGVDECRRLIEAIGADALALHLNPLQESIQPGGNTDFRGLLEKIERLCSALAVPVIVKEVGCGISGETARRLVDGGVTAIDVGGAGGTCWTEIEARRSESPTTRAVAATFREWGIPTAECIRSVRAVCPHVPLIASGGLRTGLDVAKSLALGADVAALASPVLKAAVVSSAAVHELLSRLMHELKLAMFCTGSPRPCDLAAAIRVNGPAMPGS
jgi:isopentenyl-diphosphate delta-isomerase